MTTPPRSNVVHLRKVKAKRAEGKVLCDSGFHKWQTLKQSRFDVSRGKLITVERCLRCDKERVRPT
jgi:hypothetical protein